MIYAVSDIHGCAWEFEELLKKIGFSDEDTLYVVGDVVDRGPNPIGVLRTMAAHPNILPILGNHEYMLLKSLPKLLDGMSDEDEERNDFLDSIEWTSTWAYNGGDATVAAFRRLSAEDQRFFLEYIRGFALYAEVTVNERSYILIHSLPQVAPYMDWRKCDRESILFGRPDFYAPWDQEEIYIIGHTPTFVIHEDYRGRIFRQGNLLDIDCGAVYDEKLAALCLDTGEEFYI